LLDFLLEAPIATPLVNGATLVNVPDPARFALHKLMVSGRRQVFEQTKAGKNRQQAAEILDVLYEDRRGDLTAAAKALHTRPLAWRTRLKKELAKLPEGQKAARAFLLRSLK
jgi:hypothetical protein